MEYTLDYFIKKFEAIPENHWFVGSLTNGSQYCALGHCGGYYTEEAKALDSIVRRANPGVYSISDINDLSGMYGRYGKTPKERVVNFLKEVREENKAVNIVNEILNEKQVLEIV